MKILDVSLPIGPGLPIWPGDPAFARTLAAAMSRGDVADVSRLDMGAHTGTHVDAPRHFIPGAAGAEALPLDALVGPCTVVDARDARREVEAGLLPVRAERVLFRTRNSDLWARGETSFDQDFVGLSPALAQAAVARGVRLLGIDYLGIERLDAPPEHPVHRMLLAAGIVVVEGLDLHRAEPGDYQLWCLPLRLVGSDGAPARCILVRP